MKKYITAFLICVAFLAVTFGQLTFGQLIDKPAQDTPEKQRTFGPDTDKPALVTPEKQSTAPAVPATPAATSPATSMLWDITALFNKLDKDKDGKLSREEFNEMKMILNIGPTSPGVTRPTEKPETLPPSAKPSDIGERK